MKLRVFVVRRESNGLEAASSRSSNDTELPRARLCEDVFVCIPYAGSRMENQNIGQCYGMDASKRKSHTARALRYTASASASPPPGSGSPFALHESGVQLHAASVIQIQYPIPRKKWYSLTATICRRYGIKPRLSRIVYEHTRKQREGKQPGAAHNSAVPGRGTAAT